MKIYARLRWWCHGLNKWRNLRVKIPRQSIHVKSQLRYKTGECGQKNSWSMTILCMGTSWIYLHPNTLSKFAISLPQPSELALHPFVSRYGSHFISIFVLHLKYCNSYFLLVSYIHIPSAPSNVSSKMFSSFLQWLNENWTERDL